MADCDCRYRYLNGQAERDALSAQNSDLRSDLLATLTDLKRLRAEVDAVVRAITDAGSHPDYHQALMTRHRHEWPTLWRAIDRLLSESDLPHD